jgi:hypothetical protein
MKIGQIWQFPINKKFTVCITDIDYMEGEVKYYYLFSPQTSDKGFIDEFLKEFELISG